jgi:hypothetical protein
MGLCASTAADIKGDIEVVAAVTMGESQYGGRKDVIEVVDIQVITPPPPPPTPPTSPQLHIDA